jgi:hypothetical protein
MGEPRLTSTSNVLCFALPVSVVGRPYAARVITSGSAGSGLLGEEATARGIEVILDGSRGEVEVSRYAQALTDTVWLLTSIDRIAVQEANARLRWTVADLSANGVLRARLTPRAIPEKRSVGSVSVPPTALVEGLQRLTERAEIPDLFTEASVQRVDRLGAPSKGLRGVTLAPVSAAGDVGAAVPISDAVRNNAKAAIAPREATLGSVTGVLDVLNARSRGAMRGSVYNPRTRHAVTCIVPPARASEFVEAFGRRVLVGGTLRRNELGQAISIEVAELQVLPETFRAPTVDELLGVDPGWTGELTTAEYLARVRGA